MAQQIENKVVVITGASSGIGKAKALAFARLGARLVLGARRVKELDDTAEACRAEGAQDPILAILPSSHPSSDSGHGKHAVT